MRPSGTDFNEIWIRILSFSLMKMHLKKSSARMAAILSRGRWVNIQHTDTAVSWGVKLLINSLLYGWLAGEICVGKGCHSANYTLYSVLPIYRGPVYSGIGYIAVACWTPFFCHPYRLFRGHGAQERNFSRNRGNSLDPIRWRQFFVKFTYRGCLWSGSQETIFREICSGPVWLTCEMRTGTHAVRWP